VPDPSPWSRTRVRQVAPGKEVPGAGPPPWIVQPRVVSRGGNTPFHPDAFSAATITARLSGPIAGTPPQATVLARRQDEDDEAGHDHPGLRLQKADRTVFHFAAQPAERLAACSRGPACVDTRSGARR
jgi:hypothetical protein